MHLDSTSLAATALSLLILATIPSTASARSPPKNAILLSQVRTLTLKGNGAMTTHRRVPAVPQLKCVSSPSICRLHAIDVMRCTNQGSAYGDEDIQWSCTAALPPELKLGSTDVVCEGYANSDDPYVLKGSCAVEYRMVLTDVGERRFPDLKGSGGGERDWSAYIFGVIFVGVVAWMLYSACWGGGSGQAGRRAASTTRRRPGGGGGGGGFGGGGGGGGGWFPGTDNDPPPPYPGTGSSSKPSTSSRSGGGWGPGFWTGLASGAAAGYFAGGRNSNRDNRDRYFGTSSYGGYGGGGWDAGPSRSRNNGESSGTSSARHESTGFGSTSRR